MSTDFHWSPTNQSTRVKKRKTNALIQMNLISPRSYFLNTNLIMSWMMSIPLRLYF